VIGVLNTVTGGFECCAKIRKYFGAPKPRTRVANALPKEYLLNLKRKGLVCAISAHQKVIPCPAASTIIALLGTLMAIRPRLDIYKLDETLLLAVCLCHVQLWTLVCVQVGIGGTYLSGTDDVLAGLVAQRQYFFGPNRSPLAIKLKAQADYNLQTKQVC
jgi:hypothetical protein